MSEENLNEDENIKTNVVLAGQVGPVVMLPCPFCGAIPVVCEISGEFTVHCSNDGCIAGNFAVWEKTPTFALEHWNKRLEPA